MGYTANTELFNTTFAVAEDGKKLHHHTGRQFRAFPFNTTQESTSPAIDSLDSLSGYYLSLLEGIKPKAVSLDALLEKLEKETKIELGKEELFRETVSHLFFEKGQLRSLNLKMREYTPCTEPAEIRIAEYLADVLGDREDLRGLVKKAMDTLSARSNVFERLVISKLESDVLDKDWPHYTPVTMAVKTVFMQDFEYILASETKTREYLIPLLEFYYFAYTSQACLHLDHLCDGDPTFVNPIYFSLDWEKTSQNRQCFTNGWKQLECVVENLFAHAVTLEVLNQTREDEQFDYVRLARMAEQSDEIDGQISEQINILTQMYRAATQNSPAMLKVTPIKPVKSRTASEIQYLFNSVKAQFSDTVRQKNYKTYAGKFKKFCEKNYLKDRGRSGYMLNLSEETLIFLTKVSVKDQEIMRLRDVFDEFERRGVFLDNISKERVAQYFEKLNLIEKKSDSGDAKYVKRFL